MRYRITTSIVWDFDTDLSQEQALEQCKQKIDGVSSYLGINDLRLVMRLDKIREKIQKVKLGEFTLDDILPYITKEDSKKEYEVNGEKFQVKMNSHRYFLFRECTKCIACGLQGTKVFLEHHPADKSPHFNLYGEEDDKLILMTKDHIHPKSCGGEDRHSNYAVMCIICNNLKGHANINLEGIFELRLLYNENKNLLTKKKLYLLLEESKARLSRPRDDAKINASFQKLKQKATSESVCVVCDLNVWRTEKGFTASAVYDRIEVGQKQVACIRKGTYLEPMIVIQGKLACKFEDDVVMVPHQLVKPKQA